MFKACAKPEVYELVENPGFQVRTEKACLCFGEERYSFDSYRGQKIVMGVEDAGDESFRSQPSQVVGHLGAGVGIQWYSQQMATDGLQHFIAHSTSRYAFTE